VWPWEWRAEHLEEWIEDLAIGPPRLHISTLRAYQVAIRLFCEYLLDRRYPCSGAHRPSAVWAAPRRARYPRDVIHAPLSKHASTTAQNTAPGQLNPL
jgi:hypothetical protein